jgi:hypothetical protein
MHRVARNWNAGLAIYTCYCFSHELLEFPQICGNSGKMGLNLGSKRLNSLFATTSDKQEYNIDSMQKQTTRFSIVVFF